MKKEKTMDMTRGPVLKQMAVFALPVLLGMLCQRIYNFADAYIVGRFLGDSDHHSGRNGDHGASAPASPDRQ